MSIQISGRPKALGEVLANTVLVTSIIIFWIIYVIGRNEFPELELIDVTLFTEAASYLGRGAGSATFASFTMSLVTSTVFGLTYQKDAAHFENLSISLGLWIGAAGIFFGYICLFLVVGQKNSILFGSQGRVLIWDILFKNPIYLSVITSFFLHGWRLGMVCFITYG
ncbi:hypothetical protein [Marinobacter sp. V034]|uniref:hypothetical protein n=1 Tax=Marinobacter sp. V034 TaxID=3459610 RepID=UPI0040446840